MTKIEEIIEKFNLNPHPEGGYFRETYRSNGEIDKNSLPISYEGNRNYATCIYFLLTSDTFSAFHKIKQDEIWHFYDGSPIKLYIISDEGLYSEHVIGSNFSEGEVPQFVVPGNHWFAAETINKEDYSLVGCSVSPGFDFKDFELPTKKELVTKFPEHQHIIERLTHS